MDDYLGLIRYDLPFRKAKQLWQKLCERAYLSWLVTQSDGHLTIAADFSRISRSEIQALVEKYSIDRNKYEPRRKDLPIAYHLPWMQAKQAWVDVFENAYLRKFIQPSETLSAFATRLNIQETDLRQLLDKHEIEYVDDVMETYMILRRRFYNGINFERGMIAYLHFDGKCTTREGVHKIARLLNGVTIWGPKQQYRNWNSLQIMLTQLGILITTATCSVYEWNDALVPVEYKDALVRKHAGESVEDILAFYFPKDAT